MSANSLLPTRHQAPLLPWSLGLALGVALAGGLSIDRTLAVAGCLLSLALIPRCRRPSIAFTIRVLGACWGGLVLAGPAHDPGGLATLDLERPVELFGTVVSHVEHVPDVYDPEKERERFEIEVESVRQGDRVVEPRSARVLVTAPVPSGEGLEEGATADRTTVRWGARLRLRGHLRRSIPWVNPGAGERPGPWRTAIESRRFLEVQAPPAPWLAPASRLRRALDRVSDEIPGEAGALARALVLGDRSGLPERWARALRSWGAAHVLAVSGLHVGLVAALAWLVAAPLPRGARLVVVTTVIVLHAAAVGPRPAVLRAAGMGLVAFLALVAKRPPLALHGLSVVLVTTLLRDPSAIRDPGFTLSVVATFALVVGASPLAERWSSRWSLLPRPLSLALASTVVAQIATLPILLPWTATLSPGSPLVNLFAVPWLVIALSASGLAFVLAAVGLGGIGGDLLAPVLLPLEALAEASPIIVSPPGGGHWATSLVLAVVLALAAWWPRRLGPWIAVGLVVATWLGRAHETPEMVMFDVGQGSSVLLRHGATGVLVDGGGWRRGDAGRRLSPSLAALGVRRLDAVVLTHPDTDHCRGLVDLASYLPIGEVWASPGWGEACAGELLGRRGGRWRPLWRGREAVSGPFRFETLWPPPGRRRDGNDRSLVLRASVAGRRILLTGDLEAAGERRLVALARSGAAGIEELSAEILQVAHHGSKTSTTPAFLGAVTPRAALVSAGRDNPYGHPHPDVVARLAERGIPVWRTDRHGAVRLELVADAPLRLRVAASSGLGSIAP